MRTGGGYGFLYAQFNILNAYRWTNFAASEELSHSFSTPINDPNNAFNAFIWQGVMDNVTRANSAGHYIGTQETPPSADNWFFQIGVKTGMIDGQLASFDPVDINEEGIVVGVNGAGMIIHTPGSADLVFAGTSPIAINDHVRQPAPSPSPQPTPISARQIISWSNDALVVWERQEDGQTWHPFGLEEMIPSMDGWDYLDPRDMNNNGSIAGNGGFTNPSDPQAVWENHGFLLIPVDIIQVSTFIPQNWVFDPTSNGENVFNGNSRATLTESVFDRLSTEYKMIQRIGVDTSAEAGTDGSHEQDNSDKDTGTTRAYVYELAVINPQLNAEGHAIEGSGYISQSAMSETVIGVNGFLGEAKASTTGMTVTVTHPSKGVAVAHIVGSAGIPLIELSDHLGPIRYDFTVTIDRTDPLHPTYTAEGNHGLFPSMEVYINDVRIYIWDAIQEGTAPIDLGGLPFIYQDFETGVKELLP